MMVPSASDTYIFHLLSVTFCYTSHSLLMLVSKMGLEEVLSSEVFAEVDQQIYPFHKSKPTHVCDIDEYHDGWGRVLNWA